MDLSRIHQIVLESMRDAVYVCDLNMNILYINLAAERMFGYRKEEASGCSTEIFHVDHDHYTDFGRRIRDALDRGEAARFEFEAKRKNGEIFPTDHSVSLLRDENGEPIGIVSVVRDITERKSMEQEALQKKIIELECFINNLPDMAWVKDVNSNFTVVNKAFGDAVGMAPEYLMNHTCEICFGAEAAKKFKEDDQRVMAGTEQVIIEESIIDANKNRIRLETIKSPILDASGNVVGTVGIARDITARKQAEAELRKARDELELKVQERTVELRAINEDLVREIAVRKRAEQALLESEQRYRELVETSNDIVYRTDAQGVFTFVNRVASRITGYSEEELIGAHYADLILPEYRAEAEKFYGRQCIKKIPNTYYEFPFRTKNGDTIWIGQNVQRVTKDDKTVGLQAIARDITKRKRVEEEREQSLSLLRATLESTADGILVVDTERKISSYNEEFLAMWRIPEHVIESRSGDEALSFVLDQLKCPEDFIRRVRDLYGHPDAVTFDVLEFKDGRIFERYSRPQRLGETIVGRVWSFRDVTKRRQAEDALVRAKRDWEETFDAVPDPIMILNDRHGIVRANKAMADALGVTTESAIGLTCYETVHGQSAPPPFCPHAKLLADGKPHSAEVFEKRLGGVFDVSVSPLLNQQGDVVGSVHVAHDITRRKNMEEALRESEQKYRSVFENAAVGINLKSPDGTFLEVNQTLIEMLGYSQEELSRLSYLDITHPDDVQISGEMHAALERGDIDTYRIEKRYLRKDGRVGWVDTAVTALRDSNGQLRATVGIIADITERKNAEQALRENEQKMRTLINAVPDSICFKDGEGRWQEANESSLKLFELEDVRYRGKKDSELAEFSDFYRDAFLTCEETDEKAWAAGPVSRGDEVIPLPDGSSKVLDVIKVPLFHPDGSRKGLVVVGRDITEGKRAEEALQKQYELQRALLSSIPAYVYFKDKDSVYITGNKPFSELSGTPENEIPGKTDYDFFSEMDADSFRRDDAEIIATGKAKLNYEMKGTDAEGNIIWYSTSKSPFYSTSGEVAGLVGICVDITDLKRTQELLLQSERFRAVADLAGGIAHNFNNLLQIVIGYLELALLDLESGNYPDVKDALEKVLESSRFGAETVRRLQSFAGIRDHSQLSEKGVFDLSGVVRQALEMSKTWWKTIPEKEGRKISMVTELQEGCLVQGEKNELFEAVVNLIKNASEALPQGGAIHVKTGLEGSQVVLKVRDTGIGISEKDLGRLFNPFFTTKASAGSGLGLASSRKIIEACGGSILVESSERKGTTFTIRLPLVEQPSEQASPPAQQVSGPGRTVLVIDDMQAVLDLLKAGLTRSGHVVVTASSGQQGLDIFKENPIDLVICDLGMPGINGWEVGKIIRSLCEERGIPKPPFILLTGWGGQKTEAEKISESGVDAVVEKPINIGSLREVVRQLGEREP